MFRNRSYLFMGLTIGFAVIAGVLTNNWLKNQIPPPQKVEHVATVSGSPVAVASMDLSWGTPLTKDMINLVDYPSGYVPEGGARDVESLLGRVIVMPLKRHELILESKLAPTTIKNGGVVGVLKSGNRAMAVRVNEVVGLPGFVKPGDRVDIMVTTANSDRKSQITKTVLENVHVLATGTRMERTGPGEKPIPVKVITFEVPLKDAEKLALGASAGKLRLALRSPLDTEPELTHGATSQSLLASFRAPRPTRHAGKRRIRERVELIVGGKKKILKF